MNSIAKKHLDAASAMAEVLATRLGENRAVHAETAIACAARMAGTMLFRSFGLDTSTMTPGSVVLSEQANEKGPALVSIVIMMMQQYGLQPNKEKLADVANRGEPPRLTVLQTQELLDADLKRVCDEHHLDQEDGACACALATAWLVKECAPNVGLEVGFNIAAYGFIEGTKTVPRPVDEVA